MQAKLATLSSRGQEMSLSCVVPVFNEESVVRSFIEHLQLVIAAITPDYEIVIVNDGSTDNSCEEVLRCAERCGVHYVELSRNFGKEFAIQAGLDAARGDCVVILDADFQHPPELIEPMVQRWRAGIDMVYAVQEQRREGFAKRVGRAAVYKLLSIGTDVRIHAGAGDFRLLDRKVVATLRALPERTRFMKGLYAWSGFRSEAIQYQPNERQGGQSKYDGLKLTRLAVTSITAFSTVPLRFVTWLGAAIAGVAMLLGLWIVLEKLFLQQPIPGFATLAASILFLSGLQLLALGVVGEYVGRIFDEVKNRPLYVVARDIDRSAVPRALTERNRA